MNKITSPSAALTITSPAAALASGQTTPASSMNSGDVPARKVSARCAVCAIEVPLDEAVVPEAADQLTYLCGLDCYARWRATAAISFPSLSPEPD